MVNRNWTTEVSGMNDNAAWAEVKEASVSFLTAFDNLDLDLFCAAIAQDATMFMPFANVPNRLNGIAEIRDAFEPFFDQERCNSDGPPYLNLQPQNFEIQMIGFPALVTFHLNRPTHFSRRSIVFEKRQKKWLLVHLHASNLPVESG